jgi:UDP-N-acetylmuramate dehydrogenase
VYMNAGAHGGELGRHVVRVGFLPLTPAKPGAPGGLVGEAQVWAGPALGFAYRTSRFQSERGVILWAELEGEPGDPQVSRQRLRAFAAERRQRQPVAWPNCGSVFRNPPGHRAGALVEAVGGKGRRVGQAQISPKHANFIVNLGGARAQDVLALMDWAREQVWRAFGVELEPEVCVVPGEGVEA